MAGNGICSLLYSGWCLVEANAFVNWTVIFGTAWLTKCLDKFLPDVGGLPFAYVFLMIFDLVILVFVLNIFELKIFIVVDISGYMRHNFVSLLIFQDDK